jgi:hypothetical protein
MLVVYLHKCSPFGAPVLALGVCLKLVLDDIDDEVVRNESSSVHDLLCLNAERCLLLHLFAQHVARREVADAELLLDFRRLGALAC